MKSPAPTGPWLVLDKLGKTMETKVPSPCDIQSTGRPLPSEHWIGTVHVQLAAPLCHCRIIAPMFWKSTAMENRTFSSATLMRTVVSVQVELSYGCQKAMAYLSIITETVFLVATGLLRLEVSKEPVVTTFSGAKRTVGSVAILI